MDLTEHDNLLIAAIADGLPISARPYRDIGDSIGMDEGSVIQSLKGLIDGGVIKRFGLIVRHHELGYRANAMTALMNWANVWAVLSSSPCVTSARAACRNGPITCFAWSMAANAPRCSTKSIKWSTRVACTTSIMTSCSAPGGSSSAVPIMQPRRVLWSRWHE